MCVADSYRTYERQVQLYAERPHYAAHPGTSEHGWGLAVDLCGGIETDGTPQNIWMRTHAAQFGWFHPTWADQGGGGPYEPWHWEFAG
jgi:LAS superfamily LD-carboxypeptidase LdcB